MKPEMNATIYVWPSHRATLVPVVPAVRERLLRRGVGAAPGGPRGYLTVPLICDRYTEITEMLERDPRTGEVGILPVQHLPLGDVEDVRWWLEAAGHAVTVVDYRADSPRWVRDTESFTRLTARQQMLLDALDARRAVRVVGERAAGVADAIAAVAAAYPRAWVAVAVPTRDLLRRILQALAGRLPEPPGEFTGRVRRPGRVAVGMVGQLPTPEPGYWGVLALPYADRTLSVRALDAVRDTSFGRLLSFTRTAWTGDESADRRLRVLAEVVWPPPAALARVTAVLLAARGTAPSIPLTTETARKRGLYWENARRNRRIAAVAARLATGSLRSIRSALGGDPSLAGEVAAAARIGVAILVEVPAHARSLAALLPGWSVGIAGGPPATSSPGCGMIVTELAAKEYGITAGALVRATGTRWPLPAVGWPAAGSATGVLIDFGDGYHPRAARTELTQLLKAKNTEVVILDPLYMCLLAGGTGLSATNLFDVGATLMAVADSCARARATLVVVHHTTKGTAGKLDAAGVALHDLAYAGIGEFARQWILLSRAEEYEPGSGRHDLRLSVGGSAGHSSRWRVRIDESSTPGEQPARGWEVRCIADEDGSRPLIPDPMRTSRGSRTGGPRFDRE